MFDFGYKIIIYSILSVIIKIFSIGGFILYVIGYKNFVFCFIIFFIDRNRYRIFKVFCLILDVFFFYIFISRIEEVLNSSVLEIICGGNGCFIGVGYNDIGVNVYFFYYYRRIRGRI